MVETEDERQDAKEEALHFTAVQSNPNAFAGPKTAAHNVSKDGGGDVTSTITEKPTPENIMDDKSSHYSDQQEHGTNTVPDENDLVDDKTSIAQ